MSHALSAERPSAIALILSLALCAAVAQGQVPQISVAQDQVIDHLNSDQITWIDSTGQPRIVVLAHDATGYAFGGGPTVYGGAIRSYTYPFNGAPRTADVTTYGNGGYAGFGYVTDHSAAGNCVGDDSPLGWQFPISGYQRIFVGRHHVILRITQNYQRNCPNQTRYIPVTIDWVFATGRDNPVYAITQDVASAAPVDTLYDDSRAPYGELNMDGVGFYNISGTAWGDRYKFTSTAAGDLDLNSSWTYDTPNTIPFVKEWITPQNDGVHGDGDATMGMVQTQTFDQQDAGGARDVTFSGTGTDLRNFWTKTSADGSACTWFGFVMPCPDDWAYQANADSLWGGPNNNSRLTWKTQFGFIGPTTYNSDNIKGGVGATPPGYPKKSYSVYVVLGQHTTSPVEAQIGQVETVQSLALSAVTGSVITSGAAGVDDVTNVTYQPAGYNHIYGVLAFAASGNQLDANINVGAGTLSKPIIVVSNYNTGDPVVKLAGTTLAADVDYFASLNPPANELWLTLNSNLAGATNHLEINPTTGVPAVPTGVVATATSAGFIDITWPAVPGASAYDLQRLTPGGWVLLATVATPGYGDVVSADTSYAYRVTAKNGFGSSPPSIPDVATTMFFTDDPLIAGTTFVKAQHLQELRNVVDSVRNLAGLGAGVYTDVAAPDLAIKAVHVSELRSQLDEALVAIGIPSGGYTDPTLDSNVVVKAVHFQELRDRMQ